MSGTGDGKGKRKKGLPKRTGKASMKAKTLRHFSRLPKKKDRNVLRSSNGRFKSVEEFQAHHRSVNPSMGAS